MLAPALGARPMGATAILTAVATTDRVTMPRVRLSCNPFTGVGGTAAVSAVATADMAVATAATTVAGADGSSVLAFRQ